MTLRAIFFDMGGTIETFWQSPALRRKAIPDLRERLLSAGIDLDLDDDQLCEVISNGHKHYHKWSIETMEELPPTRVWSEFILSEYSIDPQHLSAAAEDLMYFIESRFFERALRPEVPEVLEAIRKQGYKIGLISNVCCRDLVPGNLAQYGIRHYFDPIVLSSAYGRRKPDPAIFHYAARLANVPTSECLYIGDRIARDVLGARRAGYGCAVQIVNPFDHGESDVGAKPDAVITNMNELLPVLEKKATVGKEVRRPDQVCALLFDAGDILYHRPKRGHALRAFLAQQDLTHVEISRSRKKEFQQKAYDGTTTQDEYRQAVVRLYGITDPALIELGRQAMQADDNSIEFFQGVGTTLKKLKAMGYLLAIITDTANPLSVKLAWFERGGFGHVWDSLISSQEVGVQKPDPGIYSAALQQLGLTARQAVFVGHSPEELEGASKVGLKTIAFNYQEDARADFYIHKFSDLLKVPLIAANNGGKPG